MKDLRHLKYFLGIKIARSLQGIFLSQYKYAWKIILETGLLGSKLASTLLKPNHNLAKVSGPLCVQADHYRCLVGKLIYLSIIRPDITYIVHVLTQFMRTPRIEHWDTTLWVVRFLKGIPSQGIFLCVDTLL